ncbi:hypothetical protein SAY87_002390 [Trapa incisa]|uniref:Uncharacterized protein n=1 Tax=Trapa incisa TaxID=236973 RepID=A0AAN7JUN7_9MYRT|nr:hypothetical protein SAY87_002390 [Trapa incisa]
MKMLRFSGLVPTVYDDSATINEFKKNKGGKMHSQVYFLSVVGLSQACIVVEMDIIVQQHCSKLRTSKNGLKF